MMKVVFLSFAGVEAATDGVEPRTGWIDEWAARLRAAGFEVIDHKRFTSYELIMTDIARCDAMVAPITRHGSTWASTEHTSAAEGRDTHDGSRGSWTPKPVLFWRVPGWARDRDPMDGGGAVTTLRTGMAEILPVDFDDAVARTIAVVHSLGSGTATA
jgi:hypothetical protein